MRRNYVLQRMAEEGYISADEARDAQQRPLVLQGQQRPEPSIAPYFVEEIRKTLEQKYGAEALYQSGCACRRRSTPSCRRRPIVRSIADCDGSTSVTAASGSLRETSSRRHRTLDTLHDRSVESADPRRRHRAGARRCGRAQRAAMAARACGSAPTKSSCRRAPSHGRERPRPLISSGGRSRPGRSTDDEGRRAADACARTGSAGRRGAARDRQSDGPGARDGRRLQLRAEQVQSRDAGEAAGGLFVQAVHLHDGDRSRLHAGVDLRRRADLAGSRARTSRCTSRSTTTGSTKGR